MGNSCCSDDVDREGEVNRKSKKVNAPGIQRGAKGVRTLSAAEMDISKIAGTEIKLTAELKDRIKKEGLTMTDNMKLENGAVYRGYVKGQQRHGPGT